MTPRHARITVRSFVPCCDSIEPHEHEPQTFTFRVRVDSTALNPIEAMTAAEQAYQWRLDEALAYEDSMWLYDDVMYGPETTPEQLALAQSAVDAMAARQNEDIDAWARRLAEDVAGADD